MCILGLLNGAPEHDWSSDTKDYFYNNNVWALRGMQELGWHLTSNKSTRLNATLGTALLRDAAAFKVVWPNRTLTNVMGTNVHWPGYLTLCFSFSVVISCQD
jgi:hypothetical protein